MSIGKKLIGRPVLIRDNMAGVCFGILEDVDGKSWELSDSRKIHYWVKTAAVEGIAKYADFNPECRVTPAVKTCIGHEAAQIILIEDEQYAKLKAVPEWEVGTRRSSTIDGNDDSNAE